MKLGVLTNVLGDRPLSEAIKIFSQLGVQSLEIGCGGYPGRDHCDPEKLLSDEKAREEWLALIASYGMDVSALAVHGNPVHPDKKIAQSFHRDFENAVLLCEKIGVDTVVTFSGCPGGSPEDKVPNWVTCAWPDDYLKILDYQWNEVLIPYWKKTAEFAKSHGVTKIAFEMHPGFCVYNPDTLLRLRAAVGDTIGANLDPSHLIWQGMDPVMAIRELGDAIYHFHAKDTRLDSYNTAKNGVLSVQHYTSESTRPWIFRTVGYGNSETMWRDIASALRLVGYDKVMSIEHEDSLMSPIEGLTKAAGFLKKIIISEPRPDSIRWA